MREKYEKGKKHEAKLEVEALLHFSELLFEVLSGE